MKKLKQTACLLAAVIGCGSVFCGCINRQTAEQTSEIAGGLSEETVPESEAETDAPQESDAELSAVTGLSAEEAVYAERHANDKGHEKEIAEARKVLETFLDAIAHYDAESLLDCSNIVETFRICNAEETEESVRQTIQEAAENAKKRQEEQESYSIEDIWFDPGTCSEITAGYEEFIVNGEHIGMSAKEREEYELLKSVFPPSVSAIVGAKVRTTYSDKESESFTEIYYIYCCGDGKWIVDIDVLNQIMMNNWLPAKFSADVNAKSMYHAVNSALVDLDSENYDIRLLAGEHTYLPADFEAAERESAVRQDIEKALLHSLLRYYEDIETLDSVMLLIDKQGLCKAVAVSYEGQYGCYPLPQNGETEQEFDSIEAALEYAKKIAEQ